MGNEKSLLSETLSYINSGYDVESNQFYAGAITRAIQILKENNLDEEWGETEAMNQMVHTYTEDDLTLSVEDFTAYDPDMSEAARTIQTGIGGFHGFFEEFVMDFEHESYQKVSFEIIEGKLPEKIAKHMGVEVDDIDDDCYSIIETALYLYCKDRCPDLAQKILRLSNEGY